MSSVTLSSAVRDALSSIQKTTMAAQEAQFRLATGKKVNTAIDNPLNFFTAAGLNDRASDLNLLQDAMGQAVKTVDAASNGIDGMTKLLQTAQGIANSAAATADSATRQSLAKQYNQLMEQVDELMKNSGYGGINLLAGDKLTVKFDSQNTTATIGIQNGVAAAGTTGGLTARNLGISTDGTLSWSNGTGGNTTGDANIQTQLTNLSKAINTLRAEASNLGVNNAVVKTRQNFTTAMINTLQTGADALTLADTNEEGAKLISLNTRGQLSQTALSLASQREQAVLRLFG